MFIEELFQHPVFFFRVVAILIISVCLHELAHGYAALSQGDRTPLELGHITLNPVVHMGWPSLVFLCLSGICWGQMPVNPGNFRNPRFGNLFVSVAGPLMNLSLALLGIFFYHLAAAIGFLSPQLGWLLAYLNLVLCFFNLLPIPPLDGFHVASEIFPALKPLSNSPLGLFAFMILFMSDLTNVLFDVARLILNGFGIG